eukprot:2814965-Prymnesium_polylepis.1
MPVARLPPASPPLGAAPSLLRPRARAAPAAGLQSGATSDQSAPRAQRRCRTRPPSLAAARAHTQPRRVGAWGA